MAIILTILWGCITALLNRVRGGWCGEELKASIPYWGTFLCRLSTTMLIFLPLLPSIDYLIAVPVYMLFVSFGWSNWQYMESGYADIAPMSLRGLVLTLPVGLLTGLHIFALCGILMGPAYYLPTKMPFLNYKEEGGYKWIPSDYGEILFGFILGSTLVFNYLYPHLFRMY